MASWLGWSEVPGNHQHENTGIFVDGIGLCHVTPMLRLRKTNSVHFHQNLTSVGKG